MQSLGRFISAAEAARHSQDGACPALSMTDAAARQGDGMDQISFCKVNARVHRFDEMRKAVPGITQHMLTVQLRELEADGPVSRTIFAEVPPRVEYAMTQKARGLGPTMQALTVWWQEYGDTVPLRPRAGRKPGK